MATTRKTSSKTNQTAKKNPSPSKNSAKKFPDKSAASKTEVAEAKPATGAKDVGVAAQSKRAAQPAINHESIERTAYSIWEEKGCPHGREEENWLEAESRLLHHQPR